MTHRMELGHLFPKVSQYHGEEQGCVALDLKDSCMRLVWFCTCFEMCALMNNWKVDEYGYLQKLQLSCGWWWGLVPVPFHPLDVQLNLFQA